MYNQQSDDCKYLFKIVVIGDSFVGKTSIVERYTLKTFTEDRKNTIGVDFSNFQTTVENEKVMIQFWDTAGQEKFRAMASAFYKDSHGAILVYDITNQKSLDHLQEWIRELQEHCREMPEMIILGNKKDLRDKRVVTRDQLKVYLEDKNIHGLEVSAKENIDKSIESGIEVLLKQLVTKYAENNVKEPKVENVQQEKPSQREDQQEKLKEQVMTQPIIEQKPQQVQQPKILSQDVVKRDVVKLSQRDLETENDTKEKKGCCLTGQIIQ